MKAEMTSMERVLTTLSHKEPDRVPLFLLLTMHGSKELGLSIKDYFSNGDNVVEGQIRLQKKFDTDCYYPFFYACLEMEAFGGKVIYSEDGPPNAGVPIARNDKDILNLVAPNISETKVLHKVLNSIKKLKEKSQNSIPIIGVAMSPFSLPVMQLGFERYLNVMIDKPDVFKHLMKVNEEFCVNWANAQLDAGATAICYFDPVSSTTIVPRDFYKKTGYEVAKRTISRIKGATATHLASGKCLEISDLICQTGTAVVGVSTEEDISILKQSFKDKVTILGNMNGIMMRRWSSSETKDIVKGIIQKAAPGGGFILSDNHGEIPFQVPDNVLHEISEAVKEYGQYPIKP